MKLARLLLGAGLMAAVAASAWAAPEDDVAATMERWAEAYATATGPEEMLAFYSDDAVFWGTGGREPFVGEAVIGEYFASQFGNFPTRQPITFVDPVIRIYGDGAFATNTGIYVFRVTTAAGQAVEQALRYSFAYVKEDDEWVIVHQHSSRLPEPPT